MKKDLVDILACPVCKGELELTIDKEEGGEITTGSLFCARCSEKYPIVDAIPNLLPPELRQ
ncbi:MAG: methytransferase partner Trm112 [Dehalococcoidia bacterium]